MKTVFAAFDEKKNAQFAIQCLKNAHYKTKNITIIMRELQGAKKISKSENLRVVSLGHVTVTGFTTGAVVGGLAGLLIGIGAIMIPGIGGILIAGPLAGGVFGLTGTAAATASGAITGAVTGGLLGVIMGFGLPRELAKTYERRVERGAILLAVPALDQQEEDVIKMLQDHDATDIKAINVPIGLSQSYVSSYGANDYQTHQEYSPIGMKGGKRSSIGNHIKEVHMQINPNALPEKEIIIEDSPEVDIE